MRDALGHIHSVRNHNKKKKKKKLKLPAAQHQQSFYLKERERDNTKDG
jgi:hypothetical protein